MGACKDKINLVPTTVLTRAVDDMQGPLYEIPWFLPVGAV